MGLMSIILASFIYLINSMLDFLYYRLPNKLFYALFYLFPIHALLTKNYSILSHYSAFLVFIVIGFGLFTFSIFDAGDAKLLAVSVLWLGWSKLIPFLLIMALVGGGIGIAYLYAPDWIYPWCQSIRNTLQSHGFLRSFIQFFIPDMDTIEIQVQEMQQKRLVPYGIAISLGAIFSLWWGI